MKTDESSRVTTFRGVDAILAEVDRGSSEPSAAVIVQGEAGIGKSRVMDESLRHLRSRGTTVLAARADAFERQLPYSAFGLAVRTGPDRADLAELVERLHSAIDFGSAEPVGAVHGAAIRYLDALRSEGTVVLAVDDLHLADDDTVALIAVLLRRPAPFPLVLLGAVRRPGPEPRRALSSLLDRLRATGAVTTVDLEPLEDDELAALVEDIVGRPPDADMIQVLKRATASNPFFARQALLGWLERDALDVGDSSCSMRADAPELPSDRRSEMLRRVLDASHDVLGVARAAAVLGSVQLERLGLVSQLASLPIIDATRAFDHLVERGILERDAAEVFSFSHQLVRDALYQSMPPGERWQWHRQVASWLGRQPATPAVVLELAAHTIEVAEVGDQEAIAAIVRAADLTCTGAPRSSLPWYQRALALMPDDDPERGAVLSRLARALLLAGRPMEAVDAGRIALDHVPPGESRARSVSVVSEALNEVADFTAAVELVDAERRRGFEDLRSLALSAHLLVHLGRSGEAEARMRATELGLSDASPSEQLVAAIHLAHASVLLCRDEDTARWLERLFELADSAPASAKLAALANAAYILADGGQSRPCAAALEPAHVLLRESGWTFYRGELAVASVVDSYATGKWDDVLEAVDAEAPELEESFSHTHVGALCAIRAEVLANRGRWTEARQAGCDRIVSRGSEPFQVWAASGIDLLTGDLEPARKALESSLGRVTVPKSERLLLTRLGEVELAAGRSAEASDLTAAFRAGQSPNRTWITGRLVHGVATADPALLAEVAEVARGQGNPFLEARAELALGEIDVDPAQHLTSAYHLFHSLGADPWRRRVVGRLRRADLKVPRHRAPRPTTLTDAELQVARLVQQGSRNRDIAETMSISVKTVEAYLTRIYRKMGVTSRLELARRLDVGAETHRPVPSR